MTNKKKLATHINDYDYLVQQLNLLIGFIDVSDEQVYQQIKSHDRFSIGITIEELYQKNYKNYSSHILTSAFILGFTHFEDFITKQIIRYLTDHPFKNNLKATFKTICDKGDSLVLHLAIEQARKLTFAEKISLIEKNIIGVSPKLITELRFANDLRNCLMHNNGVADDRIKGKYKVGEKIALVSGEIHGFGLSVRQLAKELWEIVNAPTHKLSQQKKPIKSKTVI